jgi:CheY-like chemotaxis protein
MNSAPRPILHIEDEANDIHLLQRALVSAEIWNPVQVVKSAARAFAYLLGEEPFAKREYYPMPGLILLDLTLPSLDGLEVLKWRQLHPAIRVIPVLVLTSSQQAAEVRAAYEAGANSFLAKPASFNGWLEMVKAIRTFWLTQNVFTSPPAAKVFSSENDISQPRHSTLLFERAAA